MVRLQKHGSKAFVSRCHEQWRKEGRSICHWLCMVDSE
jgi:hypothetical protein